jgi:hypothetical protein
VIHGPGDVPELDARRALRLLRGLTSSSRLFGGEVEMKLQFLLELLVTTPLPQRSNRR